MLNVSIVAGVCSTCHHCNQWCCLGFIERIVLLPELICCFNICCTVAAQWCACELTPEAKYLYCFTQFADMGFSRSNPSALRETVVEVPNLTWDDVGGLENMALA